MVLFSKEVKYNDDEWTEDNAKFGIEHFAKNLFYFQTSEISDFADTDSTGMTNNTNQLITICPANYDAKQIRLSNIEYRIKQHGDFRQAKEWIEHVKNEKYNYCAYESFEMIPC